MHDLILKISTNLSMGVGGGTVALSWLDLLSNWMQIVGGVSAFGAFVVAVLTYRRGKSEQK